MTHFLSTGGNNLAYELEHLSTTSELTLLPGKLQEEP